MVFPKFIVLRLDYYLLIACYYETAPQLHTFETQNLLIMHFTSTLKEWMHTVVDALPLLKSGSASTTVITAVIQPLL